MTYNKKHIKNLKINFTQSFILLFVILSIKISAQPFQKALLLNGFSNYVIIPSNNALNQRDSITIEAWIRPCEINGLKAIVNKHWCGNQNPAYHFSLRNGHIEFTWLSTSSNCQIYNQYQSDLAVVQINTWQHIAVVHSSTGVKLYYNGVMVNGSLLNGNYSRIRLSSEPVRIGAYKNYNGTISSFFNGEIDDVRIWNSSISSTDILNRYSTALIGNEIELAAYYKMDDVGFGNGITVSNSSSNYGNTLNGQTIGSTTSPSFQNINLNVSLGNDTAICLGDTLLIDAQTPGATYLWGNNSIYPSQFINTSGVFFVDVTKGCRTIRDSITITLNNIPNILITDDTSICYSDSILLSSYGANNYQWTSSASINNSTINSPMVTPLNTTMYYVEGTNLFGCSSTDSVLITVNSLPNISVSQDTSICFGDSVLLSSSGANEYLWDPSQNINNSTISSPTVTPVNTTMFYIEGTNLAGCSSIDSVLITVNSLPIISVSQDTSICYGDSVLLSSSGANDYLWTPSFFITDSTIDSPMAFPLSTTMFYVEGTNLSECSSSDSVLITVTSSPNISISQDTSICYGDSIVLSASGANDYLWSPSSLLNNSTGNSPIASPLNTTTFYIEGANSVGCIKRDSVLVNVYQILVNPDTQICLGDSIQLLATGTNSYIWSNSIGLSSYTIANPFASPTITTNYTVIDPTINCPGAEIEVTVLNTTNAYFEFDINPKCEGVEVTFKNKTNNYQNLDWKFSNDFKTQSTEEVVVLFDYDEVFWAELTIEDSNGCIDSMKSAAIKTNFKSILNLKPPNVFTPNNDGINDLFKLDLNPNLNCIQFTVFNRWGHIVFKQEGIVEWNGLNLKKQKCSTGLYYYIIEINELKYLGNITIFN